MRAILISVAVLALPLPAVAQPAAVPDESTTVSELVVEARKATAVSDVVVQACAMPADSEGYGTRSNRPVANAEFDAPLRPSGRTEESPGTREFILRNIIAFREGTADFDHMNETIALTTRMYMRAEKRWIICRGGFKDIKFLHVSQDGFDDFEVDFSGAVIEWEVDPLNSHQKTAHWAARFYYPEPTTSRFDALLKSMELGRPNPSLLAPDFAPTFQARWPTLQRQIFNRWRGAHSIVFLRRGDDGSYAYKVAYGDHVVFWTVAPLDAAGKITDVAAEEGG